MLSPNRASTYYSFSKLFFGLLLISQTAQAQTQTVRIMPVGDSITAGSPSYRTNLGTKLNQDGCDHILVGPESDGDGGYAAWSGARADTFIRWTSTSRYIPTLMANNTPDVVLIHLGSNDIDQGQPILGPYQSTGLGGTVAEIEEIVTTIWNSNADVQIFVANVIPWVGPSNHGNENVTADVVSLGTEIENWITAENDSRLHLVDVRSNFQPETMLVDQIHPNTAGDEHIASAFSDRLDSTDACFPVDDTTPPETYIGSPAESGLYLTPTHLFTGTATDAGGAGFKQVLIAIEDNNNSGGEQLWLNTSTGASTTEFITYTAKIPEEPRPITAIDWSYETNLPAGDYTFYANAEDKNGNRIYGNWPANRQFYIDNSPPTISIDSPGTATSGNVTIAGSSNDDHAISHIKLYIYNNETGQFWNGNGWTSSWSWFDANGTDNWDYTLNLDAGNYLVLAWAFDTSNNNTRSSSLNLTVEDQTQDTAPPTISIDSPGTATSGNVTIAGSSSDDQAISHNKLYIYNNESGQFWDGNGWTSSWSRFDANGTDNWDYTLNLEAGTYLVFAWAFDTSNNNTRSSSLNLTVEDQTQDTAPPTISIDSPGTATSGNVTIAGSSSDDQAISHNKLYIYNNESGQFWDGNGWTSSWSRFDANGTDNWDYTLNLEAGTYLVFAWAFDTSNNNTRSSSLNLTVEDQTQDTAPPTISIDSPGTATSGNVTITGSSSDDQAISHNKLYIYNNESGQFWDGNGWTSSWSWFDANGTDNWDYTLNLEAGTYLVFAWAFDTSNNSTRSSSLNLIVSDN